MEPSTLRTVLGLTGVAILGVVAAALAVWLPSRSPEPASSPAPPRAASATSPASPTSPTSPASPTKREPGDTGPTPSTWQPPARSGDLGAAGAATGRNAGEGHSEPPAPGTQPPPPEPTEEELAAAEEALESYRSDARERLEEQLRTLAREDIDQERYEQARSLLQAEIEHATTLKRDTLIGGLDPGVADYEYLRVRTETDEGLDELVGYGLRKELRALE